MAPRLEDMEGAPVTAATGTLGPVVVKLAALLAREYKLRRRTRSNINIIRSKLKSMHSVLWCIWEREHLDVASKMLKMEALYLADDMDDAIDDFILTMESPKKVNGRSIQPKSETIPFQDLKKKAIDVSKQFRNKWKTKTMCNIFSRKNDIPNTSKLMPRAPFVLADKSQLVGMDVPRDEIVKHLVGGDESTRVHPPQIKVASIVGMAGMGKSTLARLVYEEIEHKFEAKAFVSVNPSGSTKEVLTSILQQLGVVLPSRASTEKSLINTIAEFLKEKRYMVIIDDIWQCGDWETIRRCLPQNNMGSIIVTTTRIHDIAKKWRDDFDTLIYKMDSEWDDHRKRWDFYLTGGVNVTAGIIATLDVDEDKPNEDSFRCYRPLVDMCGGMPLALVCMYSAIAKEREHQEQGMHGTKSDPQYMVKGHIERYGIQNTAGFEPLVDSLQLGYILLPHHMLKTCFLYCCIYPEDRKIERERLVRSWVAEGFVCKEETAKGYFDELVNRGLILRVEEMEHEEEREKYKMHPMMQNFLRWKLREDNFITCSSGIPASYGCRIRSLYIDCSDGGGRYGNIGPIEEINWSHIRSLVVFGGANRIRFAQLERLRVLVFQLEVPTYLDIFSHNNDEDLQNDHLKGMCGLPRLRHLLGLRGKGISEIPPEIGGLQHLETLELTRTSITKLPCEIGKLENLKSLDLKSNKDLEEVPMELGDLQNLESLCLSESHITKLPGEIIKRLPQLKSLDLSCNFYMDEVTSEIWNLVHLSTLNLSATSIKELPREVANLQDLETLNLEGTAIRKVPWEIGKLQHLETLNLESTQVKKIPREIQGLKKLKSLETDEMGALPWEACQLSQLMGLPECVRQVWKKSDVATSLAGEMLSLHLANIYGGEGLSVGRKQMHIPRWIEDHFNDLAFLDIRICKLEEEDLKILREMPNLGSLYLKFEVVPEKPVAISSKGFARLEILGIDCRVLRVTFHEGAMAMLRWLFITSQFYAGSPNNNTIGIKYLMNLSLLRFDYNEEWYRGDSKCIGATVELLRKEAREHSNHYLTFRLNNRDEHFYLPETRGDTKEENNDPRSSETAEIGEESSSRVGEVEEGEKQWDV